MKTIEEIRVENLRTLVVECGGNSGLARVSGKSDAQISQWLNRTRDSKTGKERGMSADVCRELEKACHRPTGWMDNNHGSCSAVITTRPDEVVIRQFDTGGRMGNGGMVLHDQPGVINSWRVSREWAAKNIRNCTSLDNLAIVTGFGDSMRPLFNPGDPLLVDTGVKSMDTDAVYFFRIGGDGFIKRVQRIPGPDGTVFRVKSANPEYETWEIKPGMDVEVFGRVLKIWRGEDM